MASLFIESHGCIDHTDGAGMNLMDIKRRVWPKLIALKAAAPGLEGKIGKLAPAHAVADNIALYFVERLRAKKLLEEPRKMLQVEGLTLSVPGDLAMRLGTRDMRLMQVFGIASNPEPGLEGHVFSNPVDTEGYMVMLIYKNRSLPREGTDPFLCIPAMSLGIPRCGNNLA
ncbi:unnamed protein product [Dovyalis caffra]|uniref:Uncharacterized protein n=1 Tax=Dovyalis caffra TaxID=77055 RepID=A0AAV1SA75_9ROSI|nr:unnamed protein product [Dovyalis caffra]